MSITAARRKSANLSWAPARFTVANDDSGLRILTVEWNDNQPIYRQLRDMVVDRIMDGSFSEGEAVPSVRQVAADYQINHLTVGKAYQELVEVGLLEKRRGLGMFVTAGARGSLTSNEQQRFMDEEVPAFAERIQRLGLDMNDIVAQLLASRGKDH